MRRDRPDPRLLSTSGARRRRRWWLLALPLLAGLVAFGTLGVGSGERGTLEATAGVTGTGAPTEEDSHREADAGPEPGPARSGARRRERGAKQGRTSEYKRYTLRRAAAPPPIEREFKKAPRAGILFDVETGEVLWERHPRRELPIASLTKMMTALIVAERHRPGERVRISKRAVRTTGSKVGVLRKGKRVKLEALLHGLLLVSGNDTAVALAEHDAGTVERFVAKMNREAERRGLDCTRFSSPHGLADRGNRSCPRDLAAMARAILADERLAGIVGTESAEFDAPVNSGKLYLHNNNPLMRLGRPGITGVKTGLTDAAGRCYVTTAKRKGRHLGVVLLHSPDPIKQIDKLLDAGLEELRRR